MPLITLVVLATAMATPAIQPTTIGDCIAVVPTSDIHGQIEPSVREVGGAQLRHGGILTLDGYLSILREKFGESFLLVDSGDLFQGTLAANISRGQVMIDTFNHLGYRAATFGNHEFDYGPLVADDPDRMGILKARVAEANFPFLTLNIYDKETHHRITWPNTAASILVDISGTRVGVTGVTTVETPMETKANNVQTIEFRDPAALVIAEARRLRSQGAKLVILLAHMGSNCTTLGDQTDLSSCDMDSELMHLLQRMPPATVDLAFGGHSHGKVAHRVQGTLVMQAGAKAQHLAWIEACPAPTGGLDHARSTLHRPQELCVDAWEDSGGCQPRAKPATVVPAHFLGKTVQPSPKLAALVEPYLDEVDRVFNQRIGVVLPSSLVRGPAPDSLGQVIAESMRRFVDADFGLQNLGGVRADIPAGDLRFGSIYEVLPFDNLVSRLRLTGTQIEQVVRILIGRRGKPPYLAGLRVDKSADGAWRVRTASGDALEPDRLYQLATNDFLVLGGETLDTVFASLPPERREITATDMREALVELLREKYGRTAGGGTTTVSGAQ